MDGKPVLHQTQLVGTWRLSSVTASIGDGPDARPLGRAPRGLITYTPDGWVSVVMLPGEGSGVAPVCYAGRTELAEGTVTHAIEVGVGLYASGTVQTRRATIAPDGDLLLVIPAGEVDRETITLHWTRAP